MKLEEFKKLFPLKGKLTQEIIDNADINSILRCRGARAIKEALNSDNFDISWGRVDGFINYYPVTTIERIDFMKQETPMEVTFILI